MRQLILLRHAHAESATAGQDDIARPLSATGLAEARAAGDWLREHGLRPDRVLCSTAARTREMRRSELVTVPSFSPQVLPGSNASA